MQQCTRNLFIQADGAIITLRSYIVNSIAYDIIPWLFAASQKNDWRSYSTKLRIRDEYITLDAECTESEDSSQEHTITEYQFAKLARKRNCEATHVLVRPLNGECSYQNEHSQKLGTLLEHYSNVFPENLPSGLPPDRKDPMTTDLKKMQNQK